MADQSSRFESVTSDGRATLAAPRADARIRKGSRLGPYVLERQLAGRRYPDTPWVWAAFNEEAARAEVIKIYELDKLSQKKRDAVALEAATAKSAGSLPAIVRTYFAGEINGFFVIGMEPMGDTLDAFVKSRASRKATAADQRRYINWIAAIGRSLAELHQKGILHRDITRRNVLIDRPSEQAKLADFSIAIETRPDADGPRTVTGTRPEMAPEQHEGIYTPAGDQCQLARVTWYLLAGESFPNDSSKVIKPSIKRVLERAADQNPSRRYDHVGEFVVMLDLATEHLDRPMVGMLHAASPSVWAFAARIGCIFVVVPWCIYFGLLPLASYSGHGVFNKLLGLCGLLLASFVLCSAVTFFSATLRREAGVWNDASGLSWLLMRPWFGTALASFACTGYWLVAKRAVYRWPWMIFVLFVFSYAIAELLAFFTVGLRSDEGSLIRRFFEAIFVRPSFRTPILLAVTVVVFGVPTVLSGTKLARAMRAEQNAKNGSARQPPPTLADLRQNVASTVTGYESQVSTLYSRDACKTLAPSNPIRGNRSLRQCAATLRGEGQKRARELLTRSIRASLARLGPNADLSSTLLVGGSSSARARYRVMTDKRGTPKVESYNPPAHVVRVSTSQAVADIGQVDGSIVRYHLSRTGTYDWQITAGARRPGSRRFRANTPGSATGD